MPMSGKTFSAWAVGPAAALVLCAGCFNTVFVSTKSAVVTTKRTAEGRPFSITIDHTFYAWGNLPRSRLIKVDQLVSRQLGRQITRITGLRLTQRHTLGTWALEMISYGFYNPRKLIIEGKYFEKPAPAPTPAGP